MTYNKEIFSYQYVLVAEFVRHLAYYRGLNSESIQHDAKSMFWSQTINSHLEVATLRWCNVFGSTGPNITHWQKITTKDAEEVNTKFRKMLYATTGMTHEAWSAYHTEMCDFRDKYVAHLDIGSVPATPQYDKALGVAYAYDAWVRDLISPDFMEDALLKEMYKRWQLIASQIGKSALKFNERELEGKGRSLLRG